MSVKGTIQPKIPEIPVGNSNGTVIPGKKFTKISVYFARLFSFPEIPENTVL